jgi:hypothetical protein
MDDSVRRSKPEDLFPLARLLIFRLERLSADSYWAHQASGVRGALLRRLEAGESEHAEGMSLEQLIALGFQILERGAEDIPGGSQGRGAIQR